MAEVQKLKASVYRATEPSPEDGEGDPTAMIEISDILKEHPNLMVEAVKAIKVRVKDKNERVQVIALDLLDQTMQSSGIQMQMNVMKKVLPRVLKFANPTKRECSRDCQQKAAALIRAWASMYGADGRMKEYEAAGKELARAEEKLQLQRAAAERMALSQQRAQEERGLPRLGNQPSQNRELRGMPPLGERGGRGMEQQQMQMPVVDIDQTREFLTLLKAMMEDRDSDIRNNEALAEVAMLCKGCRVAIQSQIGAIEDEDKLAAMIKLNDELTDTLELYEQALALAVHGSPPVVARDGGPQMMEANTAMTDGTEFQSPTPLSPSSMRAPHGSPPAPPGYDEEEEMRKAIQESMKSHEEHTQQASRRADMDALNDLFSSPPQAPQPPPNYSNFAAPLDEDRVVDPVHRNFDRENYGESNAIAINEQERVDRQIELMALADTRGPSGAFMDDIMGSPAPPPPSAPPPSATIVASSPFHAVPAAQQTKANSDLEDIFGPATVVAGAEGFGGGNGMAAAAQVLSAAPVDDSKMMKNGALAANLQMTAPGASAEQLQQWFLRLAVNKEGVLYEDPTVQIGLKTQYQGNKGQLGIFIGNKRQEELSDFDLVLGAQSPSLTCTCTKAGSSIAPRQQMQLTVSVECRAPFQASPPLTIRFTGGGEQRVMNLRLPVVSAKFVDPAPMDKAAFDAAWQACLFTGNAVDMPIPSTDKWMKPEIMKAMLSNGMHLALVEGSGAASGTPWLAVGRLHGATCYVKVRSDNGTLRDAMHELLRLLLVAPAR